MSVLRFPYTDLHTLNLDWIIDQLNKEGAVLSVNDKHGVVVLTGEDIKRNTTTPETVSQALSSQGTAIQTVRTQIGTTPLPTTAQSLTGAIAENAQSIADLEDNVIGNTELPTEAQTLTGAIAENAGDIGGNASSITNINNKIGSTTLPTTAQTLTGAIAENYNGINALNSKLEFVTRSVSVPYTVAANGQYNTNLKTIIDADVPTGYSVLGINGYTTNEVNVYFVGCSYTDTAYSFQIKNASADQRTGSARVWYLTKHN